MRRALFTDEQDSYRESFRRFLAEEVSPHYDEWERAGIVPRETYAKAAAHGAEKERRAAAANADRDANTDACLHGCAAVLVPAR